MNRIVFHLLCRPPMRLSILLILGAAMALAMYPQPKPACWIQGTIMKAELIEKWEAECVKTRSCDIDLPMSMPEHMSLNITVTDVRPMGGSTEEFTCDELYPKGAAATIQLTNHYREGDGLLQPGVLFEGVIEHKWLTQVGIFNLSNTLAECPHGLRCGGGTCEYWNCTDAAYSKPPPSPRPALWRRFWEWLRNLLR